MLRINCFLQERILASKMGNTSRIKCFWGFMFAVFCSVGEIVREGEIRFIDEVNR